MSENTAGLWDRVWDTQPPREEDILSLLREEKSVRWRRIERTALKEFGSFEGLEVIEIGSGAGTNAALMAKRGAKVTLLDYSDGALERARVFFDRNGLSAAYLKGDALSLAKDLLGRFEVSMSFGLTEHFHGADRVKINKAHFDVLRKGGIAFISVPNKFNPPYRIFKFLAERSGRWRVGEEYPYSRAELGKLCRRLGVSEYSFFGDSLVSSFDLINPVKKLGKLFRGKTRPDMANIRKERETFLDPYLSYALVLCAKK